MSGVMKPGGRSLRREDVAAWSAMAAAAESVDQTGENYDVDDFAERLEDPLLDVEVGTRAVWDGDELIAVGTLRYGSTGDPWHRMFFGGTVHPAYRRRGIGRDLTLWALRTAPRLSEERYPGRPLQLQAEASELNAGNVVLLERAGFTPRRWFFAMERDLAGAVPDVTIPEGLRITGFDFVYDLEALDVRNEAFADHWGSTRLTEESWRRGHTGARSFRPDLSFLALADAAEPAARPQVAAILLAHHYEADTAVMGRREAWISTIGTRRAWRKRGVATALIGAALAEARRQGFARAALGVDADNPTGALNLYRTVGFQVEQRHLSYVREF